MAQNNDFPFAMGIPEGEDSNFETLPIKAKQATEIYRSVGSKASLKKYAPTPQTQGEYGTCTAWAAGYCARTILAAQRHGWTDQKTIDANAFSPGFIYRVTMPDRDDCNGAFVSTCFQRLADTGIPLYKDFVEQCPQDVIREDVYTKAANYKIKGFAPLWNSAKPASLKERVFAVKKSIAEGNPVVIAMIVPKSFCKSKGPLWIPDVNDTPKGNQGHVHSRHALCIIAYDDDKHGGAFLLQNSWGTWWGDKGYMWVSYEDAANYIYQAVEMFKMPSVDKNNKVIATETKLAGSLRLVENTGQEMKATLQKNRTYKLNKVYRSGTRFRIYLNNKNAAYVYAITSDLTNKIVQIFPHQKGISPYLNYSYNSIPIPSESQHIRLDGTEGTDYICVLYSKSPLNIKDIKYKIARQNSRYSFQEKVKKAVGEQLMNSEEVKYDRLSGEMKFFAKSKTKTIASLFMEMTHEN